MYQIGKLGYDRTGALQFILLYSYHNKYKNIITAEYAKDRKGKAKYCVFNRAGGRWRASDWTLSL